LGAAWFDVLAEELRSGAYGPLAAEACFQQQQQQQQGDDGGSSWAARAVMVDMEPKVGLEWRD
jgi:hypothetical protein